MNVYVFVTDKNTVMRKWLQDGVGAIEGVLLVDDLDNAEIFLVGEESQLRILYGLGIAQEKNVIAVMDNNSEHVDASTLPQNLHFIQLTKENSVQRGLEFLGKLHGLIKKFAVTTV